MKKLLKWAFVVILECIFIVAPIQAYAQVSTVPSNAATLSINKIISNMGTYAAGSVGAVTTSAIATASGKPGSIVVTSKAALSAARLGTLAMGTLKIANLVGVATLVVPWMFEQSGYYVCDAPKFFCKTQVTYDKDVTGWTCSGYDNNSGTIASCENYCLQNMRRISATPSWYTSSIVYASNGLSLVINLARPGDNATGYCPASRSVSQTASSIPVAVTDSEISSSIASYVSKDTFPRSNALYDELVKANVSVFAPADPVVITAPVITIDPVVKTEKIENASGGTSTKTTTTATTVTPSQTGTKLNDSSIKLSETTTTTITIKDDATLAVKTVTNTETNTSVATPVTSEFPTDYNREVTQQLILKALDGTGVPKADSINKDTDINKISIQNDVTNNAISAITSQSVGLFNWFPQIPTAACSNPQVPNPLTHALVSVEICQPVMIFSKFISAVICVFALLGSVRSVQDAMKA